MVNSRLSFAVHTQEHADRSMNENLVTGEFHWWHSNKRYKLETQRSVLCLILVHLVSLSAFEKVVGVCYMCAPTETQRHKPLLMIKLASMHGSFAYPTEHNSNRFFGIVVQH